MKILIKSAFAAIFVVMFFGLSNCKKDDNSDNDNTIDSTLTDWDELGGTNNSPFQTTIYNIAADQAGNIYVGGGYGGEISVWNGTNWDSLGSVVSSPFTAGVYWPITVDPTGNVFAVGMISVPLANSEYHIGKWDKNTDTWINLTTEGQPMFNNGVTSIVSDAAGNIYVAGNNLNTPEPGKIITKWNGSYWSQLGDTIPSGDNVILHVDATGNVHAALGITNNNFCEYVARWNGSSWVELGGASTADFGTGQIMSITSDSAGNIYAAGFWNKNNVINNVAKWDISTNSWSFLTGIPTPYVANSIVADNSGNLYAGGRFLNTEGRMYVAKWNGSSWSNVGNLNPNNPINAVCVAANGKVYAGGDFTNSNSRYYVAVHAK